jgi:sulfite reductase (NADPH) hemoprotein beta-component
VPSGRVSDVGEWRALSGLRAVAQRELAQFRLSANQNLVLSDIAASDRDAVAGLLQEYGLSAPVSPVRHLTLACVGLPTCGLAMAESERYAPSFISEIEALLAGHDLAGTPINIRITGCPNGCARPFLAEIALVGKAPGRYNLYLGGAADGSRLTVPYRDNIPQAEILALLDLAFGRYAQTRTPGERFGDFVIRAGIVDPVTSGPEFSVAVQKLTGT